MRVQSLAQHILAHPPKLFDFMIHFPAQSGSDWYHHHVFAGSARAVDGALADVTASERLARDVTEHEYEWAEPRYDRRAVMRELAAPTSCLFREAVRHSVNHDQRKDVSE